MSTPVGPRPKFAHYFKAALGSVLIGVTLPCLLVGLRMLTKDMLNNVGHVVDNALGLMILAAIFCGPGAIVLSLCLLGILGRFSEGTLRRTMLGGALGGVVMAFLNVPGYLVAGLLRPDPYQYVRVGLLFAVAGASCGLWIAWQAWRAWHPSERFLPRFSLGTLLLLVLLWGSVLVVFQPQQWTDADAFKHGNF